MAIPKHISKNFATLGKASDAGRLAVMECTDFKTGETVYAVCAVSDADDGGYAMVPIARMIDGNPYEQLIPPSVPAI